MAYSPPPIAGAADAAATRRRLPAALLVATAVTALGGFLFGYDTAVINGANQYLKLHFQLTPDGEGLAGASAILGCIPGAMFAGFFSDRYGRRKVLFASAVMFALSALLSALPRTFAEFLIARWIGGLGVGACSMICPVYIAELAPAQRRGRLGSLFQLGIVVGIFLSLLVNAQIQAAGDDAWNSLYGWRWMFGAGLVPAVALLGLLALAPESPRWLILAGRREKAIGILSRIVGADRAEAAAAAMAPSAAEERGDFRELLDPRLRRPLLVAIVLMAVSQLSGINVVMYYSTKIFSIAGVGTSDAFWASVVVGLVNLLSTCVAIALVDRAGRRPLLLAGLAVQVVALAATGWMFHAGQGGWPLMAAILVFIAVFAVALGPIPWILCSEIFPTRTRGRAMSVATFTIWAACYLTIQTFPVLNDSPVVGPARLFWFYSGTSLLGLLFVLAYVPETKDRTLEEMESLWT